MSENPRRNPEWEHWPGRTPDDEGVRHRLRALFTSTEGGDAVTELIAVHARELEERSQELRVAVSELEQRETRARELHSRVEHVLREGSAELDLRHAELVARATELDRREKDIAGDEARVEVRARELGAVELRSAALERRESTLRDREDDLERRANDLERRAAELDHRANELDELSRTLAIGSRAPAAHAEARAPEDAHVAFTIDNGYRIIERDGSAPAPGDLVELDEVPHRCLRIAVSPYPNDHRRCAILERVQELAG